MAHLIKMENVYQCIMEWQTLADMLVTYSLAFVTLAGLFPQNLLEEKDGCYRSRRFGPNTGETLTPIWLLAIAITLHIHAVNRP